MDTTTSNTNDARAGTDGTAVQQTPPKRHRTTQRDAAARPRSPNADGLASQSRRRVRVAQGIYKDRWGLSATVKVNVVQREIRFDPGTSLKTIRTKRDEKRASLRTLPPGERHTLAHDADRYLDQVQSTLVSFADRRRDLLAWLPRMIYAPPELPKHRAALERRRQNDAVHSPATFEVPRAASHLR